MSNRLTLGLSVLEWKFETNTDKGTLYETVKLQLNKDHAVYIAKQEILAIRAYLDSCVRLWNNYDR